MPDKFILASGSPQRKEILTKLGVSFRAVPADIDEVTPVRGLKSPALIAERLSFLKAEARRFPGTWVIGSDTIVVSSKGEILGKPANKKEAENMLKGYSDSFANVYSGLALVLFEKRGGECFLNKKFIQHDRTRIDFSSISSSQIQDYLRHKDWEYCAGALRIEDAGDFIGGVEGDYWNVVGLPVRILKETLNHKGK